MQACRRRWPAVWLSACSACLVLAGCGGGRNAAPAPRLPTPLAQTLAGLSDRVAAQLAGSDPCSAAASAKELQQQTIGSIARVPAELQENLQSGVNDLVDRTQTACATIPPPPVSPPPANPPSVGGKGHGHGKGHERKHEGDQGGNGGGD